MGDFCSLEMIMSVFPENVIQFTLPDSEINGAVAFAYHALTHDNFNRSDPLNMVIQVLVDELAERMVIQWLHANGKFAEPAADKGATTPDLNHEIWVTDIRNLKVRAAIHTFLSTNKSEIPDMLQFHSLSVDTNHICGINFSVGYWLQLREKPRVKLPSLQQAAIIGWASDKNLREANKSQVGYPGKYAAIRFCDLRPVEELLQFLV
jgi:hypothetical protein